MKSPLPCGRSTASRHLSKASRSSRPTVPAAGDRRRHVRNRGSSSDRPVSPSGPCVTMDHQSPASSTLSRLPPTASQNGSRARPANAQARQAVCYGIERHVPWTSVRLSAQRSAGSNFAADFEACEGSKRSAQDFQAGNRFDALRTPGQHGQRGHRHRFHARSRAVAAIDRAPERLDRPEPSAVVSRLWWAESRRLSPKRLEDRDLRAGVGNVIFAADDMADAPIGCHRRPRSACRGRLPSSRTSTGSESEARSTVWRPRRHRPNGPPCAAALADRRRNWAAGNASAACVLPPPALPSPLRQLQRLAPVDGRQATGHAQLATTLQFLGRTRIQG